MVYFLWKVSKVSKFLLFNGFDEEILFIVLVSLEGSRKLIIIKCYILPSRVHSVGQGNDMHISVCIRLYL